MEGQLQHAAHTQTTMHQGAVQWRQKVEAEQSARQKAEEQASAVGQENQELRRKLGEWEKTGANAAEVLKMIHAEAEALRPLKVWDGHQCRVCKKPMSGAVSRAVAASLLQECGHKACLENEGRGVLPLLVGGSVALLGLSRLSKK